MEVKGNKLGRICRFAGEETGEGLENRLSVTFTQADLRFCLFYFLRDKVHASG